jgi:N6-adenosine-specific RNA methylase IME4
MDLDALLARGKQFSTIYADPPWAYDDQPPKGGAKQHYALMSLDAICALPIPELAAPRAHLHLWTTKDMRDEAKRVLNAWGFVLATEVIWVKTTKDGRVLRMLSGHHTRMSHEVLYIGVRGGLPPQRHDLLSVLHAPLGVYSEKPEAMRHRVEQYSPPSYLELFGRTLVPNWTVWGNECHVRNEPLFPESFGERPVTWHPEVIAPKYPDPVQDRLWATLPRLKKPTPRAANRNGAA